MTAPTSCADGGQACCRIVILAKAPVPGDVKTRLIPALGPDRAAALAARMLQHTVAEARAARLGPVELCSAPGPEAPALRPVLVALPAPGLAALELSAQGPGDLGQRMARALDRGLARDPKVLLIGTDCPALRAETLRAASAALDSHDAVFVPALDGGYVLVGLRRSVPVLFQAMPWSTDRVMTETRRQLRAGGIRWHELPALPDVDEPADLGHVPADWM
ncbi:MAG: TIGR04282 family arsenosugar biosynthesis glycosyltransferase [Ideonella sp.]|jgi:hypothetical protein|nr:TIGR04282 family arsenosugar biosynthesis glycosyltransferase [Ideonella sp.]